MPGAVADLTNTLGWTVMNYFAPHWVRYDSFKLHNYGEMVDFPPLEKKNDF